ncbi:MAG: hypothetical protein LZF86_110394 [Nitrospira sp.]|nr:MAG: hypothetical protein LZF86_110394 [Nitrospira sp.]
MMEFSQSRRYIGYAENGGMSGDDLFKSTLYMGGTGDQQNGRRVHSESSFVRTPGEPPVD